MGVDNFNFIGKIVTTYEEKMDEFIFTTIQPFCEDVTQTKSSKKDLISALLLYEKAKQILEKGEINDL